MFLTPTDAGLTSEERDLVAAAYDEGVLKVMVATCSLAAGINLPASKSFNHRLCGAEGALTIITLHPMFLIFICIARTDISSGRVILHGARMGSDLVGPSML